MDVDEPRGGGGATGGGGRVETPNVIYIENPQEIKNKNLKIFNQTEAAEKALEAADAAELAAALEDKATVRAEQQGTRTRAQTQKLNIARADALQAHKFAKKEQNAAEKATQKAYRSSLDGNDKIKYPCFFIGGRLYNLSTIRNMFKSVDGFLEMDFDDPEISDRDWAEIVHRVFELGRDVIDISNLEEGYNENDDPIVTGTYEPRQESFSAVKRDPFTRKEYTIEDLELMRRMSKKEPAGVTRWRESQAQAVAGSKNFFVSKLPNYAKREIIPSEVQMYGYIGQPPRFEIVIEAPLPTLYEKKTFGGFHSVFTADKLDQIIRDVFQQAEADAAAAALASRGEEGYESERSLGGRNKKSRRLIRKKKSRSLIKKKKSRKQKKSRKSRKLRRNKH